MVRENEVFVPLVQLHRSCVLRASECSKGHSVLVEELFSKCMYSVIRISIYEGRMVVWLNFQKFEYVKLKNKSECRG